MELHELLINIKKEFEKTLVNLSYYSNNIDIIIEIPKGNKNGDYSTNIAMRLAKIARKAPIKIAKTPHSSEQSRPSSIFQRSVC